MALQADLAHSTMRGGRNPSDFSAVEASCGGVACHSGNLQEGRDHIQRSMRSVQGTYAGAIASIRFTFGAQPDLNALMGTYAVQNPDFQPGDPGVPALAAFDPTQETIPSVQDFASNCLYCHLDIEPPAMGQFVSDETKVTVEKLPASELPSPEFSRFTGCAACHTPTAGGSLDRSIHKLTTSIAYTQCNTCHNRGNYDLRSMSFIPRPDNPTSRVEDYYQPISQFVRCEWTLDCVDCHTRHEAMGDGFIYGSKKEAQNTRCFTCHGTINSRPLTRTIENQDDLALRLAFLNPVINLKVGDTILITEKGEPIWNARLLADGTYELFAKATGKRFTFKPVMGTGCLQKPEDQSSSDCHPCHAVSNN